MFGPINSACRTTATSVEGDTIQLTTQEEEELGREMVTANPVF